MSLSNATHNLTDNARNLADNVLQSAQDAVLATRAGVWQAPALNVPATTGTTGAGDCFLAALVWTLDRGDAPAEALRWGVAAGAAALLHPGTTLAQADDMQRLVHSVPAPVAIAMQP